MNAAVKSMNSLLPLGASNSPSTNFMNKLNITGTNAASSTGTGGWVTALGIFVSLVLLFMILLTFFGNQLTDGYNTLLNSIKGALGFHQNPPTTEASGPGQQVTDPSVAPQDETESEKHAVSLL